MTEPEPERFTIKLPERFLCERHFFRLVPKEHPTGILWQTRYTIMAVELWGLWVSDPRVIKQCGGDTALVPTIFNQHIPVCCFLGEPTVARLATLIEEKCAHILARRAPEA
jgi:hypothetical protein